MMLMLVEKKLAEPEPLANPKIKLIATRIEALVREGRLEAQGDVKKWRFSEVRLPQND